MRRRLGWSLVRVRGRSMRPCLEHGDFALFRRARRYAVGDVVLVEHPALGRIVKAVRRLTPGAVWLEGLGAASTPAAELGAVPEACLLGRRVWRLRSRRGRGA